MGAGFKYSYNILRCQYFDHSFAFQNWCQRLRKQPLKHNSLVTGKLLLLFLAVVEAFSATSKLDIFDHLDRIWSTIPPILPLVATERGHFGGEKPKIGDLFKIEDALMLSKFNYVMKCLLCKLLKRQIDCKSREHTSMLKRFKLRCTLTTVVCQLAGPLLTQIMSRLLSLEVING